MIVLALSYFFLGERLPAGWLLGFSALVLGTVLFTLGKGKKTSVYSFLAAIFFAVSFFLTKIVYLETSLINGLSWTRVGAVLLPVALLFFPFFRKVLYQSDFNIKKRSFFLFISNKGLSAGAFLLLNYSISLGNLSLVSATQGVQYVFLFALTLIFSAYFPGVVNESLSPRVIFQKVVGVALISSAIIVLFVS